MGRLLTASLAAFLVPTSGWAQADNRSVLGQDNELLAAGAEAIRAGRYDDGIRLTALGLERDHPSPYERAAALANLCAAHAAKNEPDTAIAYCDQSLALHGSNWRAYSNRSFAYYLKGMYSEAALDLDAAAAIAPFAPQVEQLRGMINERSLRPRVTMEDHQ